MMHAVFVALARRHLEERSNEEAHHVVQKAIRLDLEDETARSTPPVRRANDASMIITVGCRTTYREGDEAVVTDEKRGRAIEQGAVDRAAVRPFGVAAKRRAGLFVGSNVVAVSA